MECFLRKTIIFILLSHCCYPQSLENCEILDKIANSTVLCWQIFNDDITFEYQVRSLGWIGLGFNQNSTTMVNSDMVIMGVKSGQPYINVRYRVYSMKIRT